MEVALSATRFEFRVLRFEEETVVRFQQIICEPEPRNPKRKTRN